MGASCAWASEANNRKTGTSEIEDTLKRTAGNARRLLHAAPHSEIVWIMVALLSIARDYSEEQPRNHISCSPDRLWKNSGSPE
jgi:hypothetical protein